jgi:hypothetical protein
MPLKFSLRILAGLILFAPQSPAALLLESGALFRLTPAPRSIDVIDYESSEPELPELIVGDFGINAGLVAYGNTGTGFGAGFVFDSALPQSNGYVLQADLNGDGRPDIGHLTKSSDPAIPPFRWWAKEPASATYTYQGTLSVTNDDDFGGPLTDGEFFDVADFNQDGRPDILIASSSEVSLYLRNTEGTYTRIVVFRGYSIRSFHVADIDNDGHPDLLTNQGGTLGVSYWIPEQGSFFEIRELPNGNIEAFWTSLLFVGTQSWVDTEDINGDNFPELFVPSQIAWYAGRATGNGVATPFDLDNPNTLINVTAQSILVEDVNADGEPDILAVADGKLWTAEGLAGPNFELPLEADSGPFTQLSYLSPFDRRIHVADVSGAGQPSIILPPLRINNSTNGTLIYALDVPLTVEVNLGSFAGYAPFESESNSNAAFRVSLSEPAPFDVTVDLTYTDGSAIRLTDYFVVQDTATVPKGQTFVDVPIDLDNNSIFDPADRSFTISISSPTPLPGSPDGGATIGSRASAVFTIVDDEFLSVEPVEPFPVIDESAGTLTVALKILSSTGSFSGKSINFETDTLSPGDGIATADVDFVSTSGALTFTSNEQVLNVTINLIDDAQEEGDESFILRLSSNEPNLSFLYDEISIRIEDDDFMTFEEALDLAGVTDPALRAPDADISGDGLANFLLWAFGLSITDGAPEEFTFIDMTPGLTLEEFGAIAFRMPDPARGDVIYQLFEKNGNGPWTLILTKTGRDPWTGSAPFSIAPAGPGFVRLNLSVGPGSTLFYQFRIQRNLFP